MKAPRPLEKDIQRAIVAYLRLARIFVAAIPNGAVLAGDAKRRAIQSNALKRSGMVPGVADLMLIQRTADGSRVGFFEVKREGGKMSPEQILFSDQCTDWRIPFAVVRSIDDVEESLRAWGWAA